jgi:hypothetical protein
MTYPIRVFSAAAWLASAAMALFALFPPADQARAAAISTDSARAAPQPSAERSAAEQAADAIARELAQRCPVAEPADQTAFDVCRESLYGGSALRQSLAPIVLWGRQRDPKATLKDTSLTQFAPDVLAGLYLPLFMFNGQHEVRFVESEGLYLIRLQAAFRNRLAPGQFPYPFWHDANKWSMYQRANEVLLWWDPAKARVKVAQFGVLGAHAPLVALDAVTPPAFDGAWMWTDDTGHTQPKVTVFDGLFKHDNPYVQPIDTAYKALASRLREGQCSECHVPSNPDHSKRLVLLQTPAHAGAEIKRLLKAVREDRMPRDETGIEQPLAAPLKAALLRDAEAFDALYDAAKRWEASRPGRTP